MSHSSCRPSVACATSRRCVGGRSARCYSGLRAPWRYQFIDFGAVRLAASDTAATSEPTAAQPVASPRLTVWAASALVSVKQAATAPAATAACKGCCGAKAAAAGVLGLSASALFSATSALMVPVYGLMAFAPSLKVTRMLLLNSSALYIGLSLLYAATLVGAWQAGLGAALGAVAASLRSAVAGAGGLAALDLSPLARMFSKPLITLLCWLHLLALDALVAREIALDGIRTRTPTAHSVLLCFFFGPTGLLSHVVTRLLRGNATS